MSDDKTKKRPQDASKINIHEPYEVGYWTNKFGCSKPALTAAVHAVGTSAGAVEKHLKGK